MRGKANITINCQHCSRITPAHAGKRTRTKRTKLPFRDHPRACGEKGAFLTYLPRILGSPPRMRGKDPGLVESGIGYGITPAHAGKSDVEGC